MQLSNAPKVEGWLDLGLGPVLSLIRNQSSIDTVAQNHLGIAMERTYSEDEGPDSANTHTCASLYAPELSS